MKKIKNILLIVIYISVLPVLTIYACAENSLKGTTAYRNDVQGSVWNLGLFLLGALAGVIGSIPIWFVDCENRVLKIIRQIIAVAIYIVATALFWIMLLSM